MSNIVFIETADDKGIALKVTFDGIKYKVEVSKGQIKKEAFVACSFTPTFGMDMLDQNECLIVAEKLALEVEKELGI